MSSPSSKPNPGEPKNSSKFSATPCPTASPTTDASGLLQAWRTVPIAYRLTMWADASFTFKLHETTRRSSTAEDVVLIFLRWWRGAQPNIRQLLVSNVVSLLCH